MRPLRIEHGSILIFVLAVVINYAWEVGQIAFYEGVELPGALVHCFVSAMGDGLLVLAIYGAVAAITRSWSWYMSPATGTYFAVALAGLVIGFAVEWWGLNIAKRWQYSELMPVIPGTGIGVVPVLQMLFRPPVIFRIARIVSARAR